MFILCCALFYNNKWLFFVQVRAHHLQVISSVFQYHWSLSFPCSSVPLCVCFLLSCSLRQRAIWGIWEASTCLEAVFFIKGNKTTFKYWEKSKVWFFFFFWSFALLEKTNLAGFVQNSCLFPLRTEEWIHEWMVATEFLFLKTTETVILNFKKDLCYFYMWWILKLVWWTKCLFREEVGDSLIIYSFSLEQFFFSLKLFRSKDTANSQDHQ